MCKRLSKNIAEGDSVQGNAERTVFYEGSVHPDEAHVHYKFDGIQKYKEHSSLYYLIKILFSPRVKFVSKIILIGGLFEYESCNYDYFEALYAYYKKHMRKFIRENRDSIIEIDCKSQGDTRPIVDLYFCIAKDMGMDFVVNNIVFSSLLKNVRDFQSCAEKCPEILLLGRFKRFK